MEVIDVTQRSVAGQKFEIWEICLEISIFTPLFIIAIESSHNFQRICIKFFFAKYLHTIHQDLWGTTASVNNYLRIFTTLSFPLLILKKLMSYLEVGGRVMGAAEG